MFGGKKSFGGGYNVSGWSGTSQNVSDAIKERELTNREGITADKEVKLEEWKINMEKAKAEREATLANIHKDLDVNLANIKADSDVRMKETTAGIDSDQNFRVQTQELDNTAKKNHGELQINQQSIEAKHQEKMKMMDMRMKAYELECTGKMKTIELAYGGRSDELQSRHSQVMTAMTNDHEETKQAMQIRGKFALTALDKGGRSLRLGANALTFGNSLGATKRMIGYNNNQGLQQNQIGFDCGKMSEPSRNEAIALPGPGDAFDSDGEDENINDSTPFDMDLNMDMEEMKYNGELKIKEKTLENTKLDKSLELERLKLEQKKMEIEMAKLALLADQV